MLVSNLYDKSSELELGIAPRTLTRRIVDLMKRLGATTRFQAGWLAAQSARHGDPSARSCVTGHTDWAGSFASTAQVGHMVVLSIDFAQCKVKALPDLAAWFLAMSGNERYRSHIRSAVSTCISLFTLATVWGKIHDEG